MRNVRIVAIILASLCVILVGCQKSNENGGQNQVKLRDADVVGEYSFTGYGHEASYELDITFDKDHTGYFREKSELSSRIGLKTMSFKWSISGDKVFLNGVVISANSDMEADVNESASREFKYAYGMLLPGKGFIEGYAKKQLLGMVGSSIDDYIDCTASFEKSTGNVYIDIVTKLDGVWPGMWYRYGLSEDYHEWQYADPVSGRVRFCIWTECCLYIASLAALNEREREEGKLDRDAEDARKAYENYLSEYIKSFKMGDFDCRVGVQVNIPWDENRNGSVGFSEVMNIELDNLVVADSVEEPHQPDNNGNNGENGGDNVITLLPGATGSGTLANPFNIEGAINAVKSNGDVETAAKYYVKGRISNINYLFDQEYGVAVFDITNNGQQNDVFLNCHSVFFLENTSWTNGNQQISVGDNVIVCGNLRKRNDAYYETVEHKAFIYSLNGNTTLVNQFAVDLGLSVKWASRNIGALSSEDLGDRFAWGETISKNDFSWSNYVFGISGDSASNYKISKYNTVSKYGTVDNKVVLEMEDDAARVNWGGDWKIPTKSDCYELIENCTWKEDKLNGKEGYIVTGKNGNSIFIQHEIFLTSSLDQNLPFNAYAFYPAMSTIYVYCTNRSFGFYIRPVVK